MGFLYLRYFDGSWIKKLSNTLGRELHPKQESKEVRYFELRWFDPKKIKTYTARNNLEDKGQGKEKRDQVSTTVV